MSCNYCKIHQAENCILVNFMMRNSLNVYTYQISNMIMWKKLIKIEISGYDSNRSLGTQFRIFLIETQFFSQEQNYIKENMILVLRGMSGT